MWGGIKCSASCHTVVENIILSDKKIVSSYVPVLGPVMPVTILMSVHHVTKKVSVTSMHIQKSSFCEWKCLASYFTCDGESCGVARIFFRNK